MIGFGDLVEYDLRVSHGGIARAYVIGEPAYSENGSHVVLATESAIGMPINASYCKVISGGHAVQCRQHRDRYLAQFPGDLK